MTRYIRLWGAEGDDENDTDDTSSDSGDDTATRVLTEEEINKMVTRAADRGSRKAAKALAQDLGFETVGEAKTWFAEQRAAEEADKSEEAKVLEEARKATAESEALQARMRADRLSLRIDREVLRAGIVDEKRAARIATLVKADLDSDIDEDDWSDSISTLLGEMKEETPELFGKSASHGSGDGGASGDTGTSTDQEKLEQQIADEYKSMGFIQAPSA